jgi:hypothetical protein
MCVATNVWRVVPYWMDLIGCGTGTDGAPDTGGPPPDTSNDPYLIIPRRQMFVSRRVIQH